MADIPLIDPPTRSFILADGRQLDWQEFGRSDGRPVLYFHGGGSLSIEAGIFHREAVERNIRLIATNRPGAAGSSLCPGRTVAAYSDDLRELLASLGVEEFACFGESNGGMVTLAVAATMPERVVGAVPINPTVPWRDPIARRVSPGSVGVAYRMMRHAPRLLAFFARIAAGRMPKLQAQSRKQTEGFDWSSLIGPPPGTVPDVGEIQWRTMSQINKRALLAEVKWASMDWGFDPHAIPARLDFFCGVHDAQAPFAMVLADHNRDARFHYFSFGHHGFSHPDARRRILDTIAGYFGAR